MRTLDDDLSDVVPSEKFWAEFPDGVVPITHTEHLFWSDNNYCDQLQALEDTAALYDEARARLGKIDAVYVEMLIKDFKLALTNSQDATDMVHAMVRSGLRVGPILSVVPRWIFDKTFRGLEHMTTAQLTAFDDDIMSGESYFIVSKRHGLSTHTGRNWSEHRGFDHVTAMNEATWWWMVQAEESDSRNVNRATLLAQMLERYPYSHFDRTTIAHRWKAHREGTDPIERDPTWKKPNW